MTAVVFSPAWTTIGRRLRIHNQLAVFHNKERADPKFEPHHHRKRLKLTPHQILRENESESHKKAQTRWGWGIAALCELLPLKTSAESAESFTGAAHLIGWSVITASVIWTTKSQVYSDQYADFQLICEQTLLNKPGVQNFVTQPRNAG